MLGGGSEAFGREHAETLVYAQSCFTYIVKGWLEFTFL